MRLMQFFLLCDSKVKSCIFLLEQGVGKDKVCDIYVQWYCCSRKCYESAVKMRIPDMSMSC